MKRKLTFVVAALLVLGVTASFVFAGSDYGKSKKMYKDKDKGMTMEYAFFKKVKKIYSNQEDLGVTEEQLGKVKEVKIALKKDLISKKAELDLVKVDITSLMYNDEFSEEVMDGLIDKKYDIKKAKEKRIVSACVSLNGLLTEEQKTKMKELKKMAPEKHMYK